MTSKKANQEKPRSSPRAAAKDPGCFTDLMDEIIRNQGFSVRKAKKIRNAIFASWIRALQRGDVVETPVGEMKAVHGPKPRFRYNYLNGKRELVLLNQQKRRIVFTPWPGLIEEVPTLFYGDDDAAILKELGRKPWATTQAEHEANLEAGRTALAERAAQEKAKRDEAASRERMSPSEIRARAQRSIADLLNGKF